mmetsp:Transcript_27241/g.38312  ORF Transcript_27241/g.38312 Transcript_27241/m.38312 type:complete len:322 (+) Transcript_27241:192-1157(+)
MSRRLSVATSLLLFLCFVLVHRVRLGNNFAEDGGSSLALFEYSDPNNGRQLQQSDPKTVAVKTDVPLPKGTVIGVINTPKCGTGTLTGTFIRSFKCGNEETSIFPAVTGRNCPMQNHVLRTHDWIAGGKMLRNFVSRHEQEKCMVVTAIRDPQTWLASLFFERKKGELCDGAKISSAADFVLMYRRWLLQTRQEIRTLASFVIPHLLKEFGAKSLTEEFMKMNANGGYSLLHHPKRKSLLSNYHDCDLLFLRMEDNDNWENIVPSIIPGTSYSRGESRADLCPNVAEYYQAIKNLKLTALEKRTIMGDDRYLREYFSVYNF